MDDAATAQSDAAKATVVDLLGLIGCGLLFAFETLSSDCTRATEMSEKRSLGGMAVAQFGSFERVEGRLRELGADPDEAIGTYVPTLTEFHRKTAPRDLLEGLLKTYVGDGISRDFGLEIAAYVDPENRAFIQDVLVDRGQPDFVVPYVQQALAEDPGAAGRLALWGRRLMGEALAQAQRVAADRPELARLVFGGPDASGAGLTEFAQMLARMTQRHSERMQSLGLAP